MSSADCLGPFSNFSLEKSWWWWCDTVPVQCTATTLSMFKTPLIRVKMMAHLKTHSGEKCCDRATEQSTKFSLSRRRMTRVTNTMLIIRRLVRSLLRSFDKHNDDEHLDWCNPRLTTSSEISKYYEISIINFNICHGHPTSLVIGLSESQQYDWRQSTQDLAAS